MHAVVAHFDQETESVIKKLWNELSDCSISTYAQEVADRRPHITLASYKNLDLDAFIPNFDQYYHSQPSLPLALMCWGHSSIQGHYFSRPPLH